MRYNFFDYSGKVNGRTPLPKDINQPIIDLLSDNWSCPELIAEIRDHEKCKNCGTIEIIEKGTTRRVSIKTNYGMIEGVDLSRVLHLDKYMIITSKHIKNDNLSMKKEGATK